MREYKYHIILTLTEINRDIVWDMFGTSKKDAISRIDILAPCIVKSCTRINITDHKRPNDQKSLAFVDGPM